MLRENLLRGQQKFTMISLSYLYYIYIHKVNIFSLKRVTIYCCKKTKYLINIRKTFLSTQKALFRPRAAIFLSALDIFFIPQINSYKEWIYVLSSFFVRNNVDIENLKVSSPASAAFGNYQVEATLFLSLRSFWNSQLYRNSHYRII
jgi:hypothetical protein